MSDSQVSSISDRRRIVELENRVAHLEALVRLWIKAWAKAEDEATAAELELKKYKHDHLRR